MARGFGWGILGAAKIARTALVPAIRTAAGARLVALATRDPTRAAPFVAVAPDLKVHAGYDALLSDPEVDAVYIALPNDQHVAWTLRALAAGKHVLCEKPMALVASDIDRVADAAARAGRLALEAMMAPHHPQWTRVRALLADGAVGRLHHIDGVFTYEAPPPGNYRLSPAAGGGALRDVGVYPVACARFATGLEPDLARLRADIRRMAVPGQPDRTAEGQAGAAPSPTPGVDFQVMPSGSAESHGAVPGVPGPRVDTFARVWAEFPGVTLSFYTGMAQFRHQAMVFHGTDGLIRLAAPFNGALFGDARIDWHRPGGVVVSERFNAHDPYRLMVEDFQRVARGQAAPLLPLAFARGTQAVIDAILAAEPGD